MILPLRVNAALNNTETENSENILQQEVKEYALKVLPDMLASIKSDADFNVNIQDYNNLYIGQPFQIPNI